MQIKRGFTLISILALALGLAAALPAASKHTPKITLEQAKKIALATVPGGTVKSAELEKEKGQWIYSFDIQSGREIREVWIDPETGKVLANELESPAAEKAESKGEAKR
ncbi:MAG: PepSY domain-containing protein [Acidobacteriota bacterium]